MESLDLIALGLSQIIPVGGTVLFVAKMFTIFTPTKIKPKKSSKLAKHADKINLALMFLNKLALNVLKDKNADAK